MFKKVYSVKMSPNFVIIPFQKMQKNPLKHFTFRQKSIGFCFPLCEIPQPLLTYATYLTFS